MQQLNNSSSSASVAVPIANQLSSGVLGLCFLFGIPANVTVVVMILRNFKRDNFTLQLMLNLAASDILCLITLPLWIHSLLAGWTFSQGVCKALCVLVYISLYSSVMTVTLMSVQRYFAVLYSRQWARLGRGGERALLCSLWILAAILSSPAAVIRSVRKGALAHSCEESFSSDGQRVAVNLCETLLGFVTPFTILVTSYCCLHKKVYATAFFSNKRLTRLVTNIIVTFFILWVPVHVVNTVEMVAVILKPSHAGVSKQLLAFCSIAENIVGSLSFINSCVNPLLYAFASQKLSNSTEDAMQGERDFVMQVRDCAMQTYAV
ncbi:hypothetical protein ACEWY4_016721 [Coilia grayii]|uniref:G-protein coupled receptors family 1 profile domain-containing protein n=1 Tax=Coilia grayii TaxID=363190 RepID=A0ABD1JL65_9TELE